jgi:retron-type reverse transcriptase
MERREKQELNRKHYSTRGHRADNVRKTLDAEEFKLRAQSNSWMRIGQLAKTKEVVFNNLFQHFNVENLREAYHAQDGSKAVGIDLVTKKDYARNLDVKLKGLVDNLHRGTYRPQPKRRVQIPKSNGKMRPIAIASFDAIKIVYQSLFKKKQDWVVDIDIASFFDTVSHRKLIKMLEKRISDRKILSLTSRFIEAGVMVDGMPVINELGVPQGGIVSPTLANIYLHHVLDTWFITNYASQGGVISRYADDVVFTFKDEQSARNFLASARLRLAEYNLQLNEDKSGLLSEPCSNGSIVAVKRGVTAGKDLPQNSDSNHYRNRNRRRRLR